ncbi:MAG: amidohydrolase [Puia sp.]|nr:amidohydrolase [Puia sp.]
MATHVIHNASLLSFHPGFRRGGADALAVDGDRIEAIGTLDELRPLVNPSTRLIDARGMTLMPGLHDTHIHVWKVGNLKTFMLDVRAATSLEELLTLLQKYREQHPGIGWITARGFNEAAWEKGRIPTREDLDKVIPDKPVYLIRTCAHIAVANSKALELAGVTGDTPAPSGGVIHKDSRGRPNGIFSETALGLISSQIPPYTREELKIMIRAAREEMYRYGITAVTDPAVDPVLLEAYYEMDRAGELGCRLQAMPILLPDGGDRPYPIPECHSSDHLTVNTVKFFSDGGLSGQTAALKRPYKGSAEQGVLRLDRDRYLSLCCQAHEKGFGVATHAIGDAAIEFVTNVYQQLNADFPGALRRIEHLGLPEERHLQTMAACDIATSMQAVFISELGKNFVKYLDEPYLQACYPIRSVLQHGILTALSSDAPVVKDFNPFKGMEAAITRKDNEGKLIAEDEGIRIEEALTAYTASAAKISRTPGLGSLEAGKFADFIILDRDPLHTPPAGLTGIKVFQTYVGGNCVWSAE